MSHLDAPPILALSNLNQQAPPDLQALMNQTLLDSVCVGIVLLKNRRVAHCNPFAEQLFGFAPGTMVGTSIREWYVNPDDFDTGFSDFFPTWASVQACTSELIFRRQSNELFWARVSGRIFETGSPMEGDAIWVIEDTSERHAVELAMRSTTALTGAVFNNANVSIISTGTTGIINLVNDTAQRWLGYTADELVGKATPSILHDLEEVQAHSLALSQELGMTINPGFDVFVTKARLYGCDEREWTYIRKDCSRFFCASVGVGLAKRGWRHHRLYRHWRGHHRQAPCRPGDPTGQ